MKKLFLVILAIFVCGSMCYAGQLGQNEFGFFYVQDDGTLAKSKWVTIDLENNGMQEYFYFNEAGIMAVNTTTPDGYQVNEKGQWVENGQVKYANNNLVGNGSFNMTNSAMTNNVNANWMHIDLGYGVVYDGPKVVPCDFMGHVGDIVLEGIKIKEKNNDYLNVVYNLKEINVEDKTLYVFARLVGYDNEGFMTDDVTEAFTNKVSGKKAFPNTTVKIVLEEY